MPKGASPGSKDKASILSVLFFNWIGPLVKTAYHQPLQAEHLHPLPPESSSSALIVRFEEAWAEQLAKPKGHRSLAKALMKVFRKVLIVSGIVAFVQQLIFLSVPLIIQKMLQWLVSRDADLGVGIGWAFALFAAGFCGNGLLTNHYVLTMHHLGMDARTILNGVTYAKALRLSNKGRQSTSTGTLVTLLSNDAQRLPDMALSIHAVWSTTIFIIAAIFLLVRLLGPPALAGVLFLVLMIPVQGFLATKQMGLQRAQIKYTESRVKVVNEVIQGIRTVKYYAWEAPFAERMSSLRDQEMKKIKYFAFVNAYSVSVVTMAPYVMITLTLVVHFKSGGDFNPDVIFAALSLFIVLRQPLMMLPMTIAGWVQGKISVGRMQKFFELDELHPADREWTNRDGNGKGAGSISASGRFVWTSAADDDETDPDHRTSSGQERRGNGGDKTVEGSGDNRMKAKTKAKVKRKRKTAAVAPASAKKMRALEGPPLGNNQIQPRGLVETETPALAVVGGGEEITKAGEAVEMSDLLLQDLDVPAGTLVAVVGQIGSGKSSFLSALLGEMTKIEGRVSIDGSVAYMAQTAWIVSASLKNNVLMGKPLDERRYQNVLEVCDLQQDLAQLPAGDETEIGEKGINLSGGQKQRVSLARAAYADADVYILDDPLSAVDSHVARHLFDDCLAGFLKGKTIIMCTHQLQFLPYTDLVLVLQAGRVVEKGKYGELVVKEGSSLSRLVEAFAEDGSEVEDYGMPEEAYHENKEEEKEEEPQPVSIDPAERVPLALISPFSSGRSSIGGSSRKVCAAENATTPSADAGSYSVGEATDTTIDIVESRSGSSSPVSASSSTKSYVNMSQSSRLSNRVDDDGGGDPGGDADLSASSKLHQRRARFNNITTKSFRRSFKVSNSNRQSFGGGFSAGGSAATGATVGSQETVNASGTLQTVEGREHGAVSWKVFRVYFKDGAGGWFLPILLITVSVVLQVIGNVFDLWLAYWTDQFLHDGATGPWYPSVYAMLCLSLVASYLTRALVSTIQAVRSSKHLHAVLCRGVMRSPVSFFDTTPIGRVLKRFAKDMDSIDLLLPRNVTQFITTLLVITGSVVTMVVAIPPFAVVLIPIMVCYYRVQMFYRPINRNLKRLESLSRSPIFAQFSETLNGVSTLRAYNQQTDFIDRNSARLDESSRALYHVHVSNRWLALRLEIMGTIMTLAAALLVVSSKFPGGLSLKEGLAGLVLTYTQQITVFLGWAVRMGCNMEAHMTAVERVQEYADLTPEASAIVDDYRPPKGWPTTGAVKLEGIQMRYRPGLDLALKGVTVEIEGGSRIGIAGRTGSGKSSLMVTLFRIVEPCGGRMTIDGINVLRVGLQDLRRAISVIPQDPVMFCGTVRENLDPFGLADDVTIWAALEAARLSTYVSSLEGKLEAEVNEGGCNLSLGQRQLICLARAMLRRNKILVMDEATANVDVDTDSLIQKTVRQEFSGCTVLTIAHRLNTIMDSDKIIVMKDGKVGEFDTPANLVANKRSLLMGFIYKTGVGSSRHLVSIANANVGCETDIDGSAANTPPLSTSGGDGDISGDDGGESGAEKPIAEVVVSVATR